MSRQWIRDFRLSVSGRAGQIDLSELRCRFTIRQRTQQVLNTAEITITNIADSTANEIVNNKEYSRVELYAGYEDNIGLLFSGEIKQRFQGRENPTDTYLFLNAADTDKAYNNAVASTTLAAGSTSEDKLKELLKSFQKIDPTVSLGLITPDLTKLVYPRAVAMYGMARNFVREIALLNDATWWFLNGKLNIVEIKKPGSEDIVLNSTSGLIGLPTQSFDGILARCLINPQIQVNKNVIINQKSIQRLKLDLGVPGGENVNQGKIPSLAGDGRYRVGIIDIIGDTRGTPWYMDLTCTTADGEGWIPVKTVLWNGLG